MKDYKVLNFKFRYEIINTQNGGKSGFFVKKMIKLAYGELSHINCWVMMWVVFFYNAFKVDTSYWCGVSKKKYGILQHFKNTKEFSQTIKIK